MWQQIILIVTAYERTARLLEEFFAAYLSWKVQKIRSDHRAVNEARNELIIQINLARQERDSQKLINYNRALWLVEYASSVSDPKDSPAKG